MRQHQLLDSLNHLSNPIVFLEDGYAIPSRETYTKEVELPTRVADRTRRVQQTVARIALGDSFDDISAAFTTSRHAAVQSSLYDSSWTLEDVPAEVQADYHEWVAQAPLPPREDIIQAAQQVSAGRHNRLEATEECPHCSDETSGYACRVSGWTRQIYSYPLLRARDTASGDIYEVPLDIALLISQQPDCLQYGATPHFSGKGFVSADYSAVVANSQTISADYAIAALDGTISPQSDQLELLPSGVSPAATRLTLGEWRENKLRVYTTPTSAHDILSQLQNRLNQFYGTRVSQEDYNAKLVSLRQKLAQHGLKMAFTWKYMGMGESDAVFSVLDSNQRVGLPIMSGDAYMAFERFEHAVDEAITSGNISHATRHNQLQFLVPHDGR